MHIERADRPERSAGLEDHQLTKQGALRPNADVGAGALRDRHLDAICRTAANLFSVPFSSVSLLDQACQFYAGREGFTADSTPRSLAFCDWTLKMQGGEPLIILDTLRDARFAAHPLVTGEPHLRFYIGLPLSVGVGRYSATFCIADNRHRSEFSSKQIGMLRDMAIFVEAYLSLRAANERLSCGFTPRVESERMLAV